MQKIKELGIVFQFEVLVIRYHIYIWSIDFRHEIDTYSVALLDLSYIYILKRYIHNSISFSIFIRYLRSVER